MPFQLKKNPEKVLILATGSGWQLSPMQSNAVIYCLNDYISIEKYGVQPDVLFMMDILDERSKKPFISFTEISERVKLFPDPVKTIVRRVLQELEGEEKYYLFAMRQRKMEMGRF